MTMMMIKISSFHFPTECHFPPPGRLLPYYYSVRTCYHSRSPPAPISHGNNNLGYRRYPPAKFGSSATRTSKASPKDIEISCSDGLFSEVFGEAARNDGIDVVIEETGTNQRTIRSKVVVNASLDTVWNVLTDYERLPDFIPGLTVSQLLQKQPNFARLFQIGEQTFLFGLKLDAKGVIDCYEKELQILPHGRRRDIYFKMIEGDFQVFEGKWSVEQYNTCGDRPCDTALCQELWTTLLYAVRVEPKLWLPVRLLESKLSEEIKANLSSVREEAQRVCHSNHPSE